MKAKGIRYLLIVMVVGLAWSFCSSVRAMPIDVRIDLSNLVGTTGGNWNNVSNLNGTTGGLIDFGSGAATTMSITGGGDGWSNFIGDSAGAFINRDWLVQPATRDGAGLFNGGRGTFTLNGLNTLSSYQIEIVSARTTFGYQNRIEVDGAKADSTFLGATVNTIWNSTTDGLTPSDWLIWTGVSTTTGSFTITDSAIRTLGIVNAIRVLEIQAPIPEPATVALLGIGLVGLAGAEVRRRRKKKAVD